MIETDYLVVGSGISGLYFALNASAHGTVTIITKRAPDEANTAWAQGGISGVFAEDDSFEMHVQDTLIVGDGLCHPDIVAMCVREAPGHIQRLADEFGAHFGRLPDGSFELGREGGHSARRVVHAKDATGAEIERALLAAVRARGDRIRVLDHHLAVDLLSMAKYGGPDACFGAYVLDTRGDVDTIVARATVLASGGCGKVYLYTTNPDVATGDGVAMAYRVGARVANMEFIQFHPTCLYHPYAKSFLISEALRGEGGVLKLRDGQTFMERYHPMKSLAPRDVVARAVHNEIAAGRGAFLDCREAIGAEFPQHFPTVYAACKSAGIDPVRQPIPVAPAEHYHMGGVWTDARGRTSLDGLWAAGEVASTGVHGANRLASNSLLEAVVFAARIAEDISGHEVLPLVPAQAGTQPEQAGLDSRLHGNERKQETELRATMSRLVGVVRDGDGLADALATMVARTSSAARAPNTSASSSELEASRLAPWTPVQATSPTAQSPSRVVRPSRSVRTPPMA